MLQFKPLTIEKSKKLPDILPLLDLMPSTIPSSMTSAILPITANTISIPKKRGRPIGSKNKPKIRRINQITLKKKKARLRN